MLRMYPRQSNISFGEWQKKESFTGDVGAPPGGIVTGNGRPVDVNVRMCRLEVLQVLLHERILMTGDDAWYDR